MRGAANAFKTDFGIHSVPCSEVLSGGPPKDGIPAIDSPVYVTVADADTWLKPMEPVVFVEIAGDARAFPLQILVWHELVNAEVGNVPVVVTFCPLRNTAIAFERTVSGTVLDFGATGRLRFSNLIMYDRATESWWQQANGKAIAYPYDTLKNSRVVNSSVQDQDIIVLWQAGKTSPFSGDQISGGADVGSITSGFRGRCSTPKRRCSRLESIPPIRLRFAGLASSPVFGRRDVSFCDRDHRQS
jgi:hypothetical protein